MRSILRSVFPWSNFNRNGGAILNRYQHYILDPADIMGEDYPSETFRVLKKNEEREFGEYRTQRLVLAAWDQLERGELH